MEQHCLDNGTYYVDACGPRDGTQVFMSIAQWRDTYTAHREFDAGRVQHFAGKFREVAEDSGGGSNGYAAQRIADAWFNRNVNLGEDQAASFYREVCKQMRLESPVTDIGPGHTDYDGGSLTYMVGEFLYKSCARDKGFELYALSHTSRSVTTLKLQPDSPTYSAGARIPWPWTLSATSTSLRTACARLQLEPILKPSRHDLELTRPATPIEAQVRHAGVPSRPRAVPW